MPLSIDHQEGVNDFGKRVRFYFNYSGENRPPSAKGFWHGIIVRQKIMEQETFSLEPWGVVIVEEN